MKFKILIGFIIILILSHLYFSSLSLILFPKIDTKYRNVATKGKLLLVVPKTAKIGNKINVEVYYSPTLFEKLGLLNIMLVDSTGAYDINTPLNFSPSANKNHLYKYELGRVPFYKKFEYTIPSRVCPEDIVYSTCKQVSTKKGKAHIQLTFDPEFNDVLGGEGYQGDGESVIAPIEIE